MKEKKRLQPFEIQPLNNDVLGNLSIEELEERLELQILQMTEAQLCYDCGSNCGCNGANCSCNGQCSPNVCVGDCPQLCGAECPNLCGADCPDLCVGNILPLP